MFGYVRPALALLPQEEKDRYQGVYCGLCHAMGERHGFLARFVLSYDFAFLAMLFTAGQDETWCRYRCPAHPLKKKRCCLRSVGLDSAADASLILTWHKLRDDVEDESFLKGLSARLLSFALRRPYEKAKQERPDFAERVEEELARLRRLEEQNTPSVDRTADAFACILKDAAPTNRDDAVRRIQEQLLYHVGRWIYLVDAWDDLQDDRGRGNYNPLIARFGDGVEQEKEYVATTMSHSLKLAVSAANLIEFGRWEPVVNNMLYQGLPAVQEAVLSGRWKEFKKLRREKGK